MVLLIKEFLHNKERILELEEQVARLKAELSNERHHNRRSALVDKADLPKCKSIACHSCDHIALVYGVNGAIYVLGCGKDLDCPDFTPKTKGCPKETLHALQQYLEQLMDKHPSV